MPQMNGITENAVYALFNPNVSVAKELPLTLYECGELLVEGRRLEALTLSFQR